MPLSPWEALQRGEISSEELEIPKQTLAVDEADAFLDFIFSDLARKPEPLSLQEGASVAHYLLALSRELPDKEDRIRLLRQAQFLWRTLFTAPWRSSSRATARRFLRQHADMHLGALDVDWVCSLIEGSLAPEAKERAAPQMISRRMAVSGDVNPHLLDDLSERIYAAYHALRENGIKNARGRIAKVLNAKKLYPKPQARRKPWDGDHVIERVRAYERRSLPPDKRRNSAQFRERQRRQKGYLWLYRFRTEFPPGARNGRP